MGWIRENWSVISGLTVALIFVGGVFIKWATVETLMTQELGVHTKDIDKLTESDERIILRVEENEKAIAAQKNTLIRIETQQTAITETTKRMDKKIDKLDDKLERLLRRR